MMCTETGFISCVIICVVDVLRACLSVCIPKVTGMPAAAMLNLDLL